MSASSWSQKTSQASGEESFSDLTASSDEMDAQQMLEHPVSESRVAQIKAKSRVKNIVAVSAYSSLALSQQHLKVGIKATKLNWSNSLTKDITLQLSNDHQYFQYYKPAESKTFWDKVRGFSKINLAEIAEISYGAVTSTFANH